MQNRYRTLRKTNTIRQMVAETNISARNLLVPVFVTEGTGVKEEITSMPGYYRYSLDTLKKELKELWSMGLGNILLFAKIPDEKKDETCKEARNPNGLLPNAVQAVKDAFPEMNVMSDVALDPFSVHGHDGLVKDGKILNDETVEVLTEMSLVHARAGVDFVAPSDMMDGRVAAIRQALEENHYTQTGIMAYSAKYASAFYGPFRDALDSAPGFGDKKTYQMDFRNRKEAIRETLRDIKEGADIVMIKPALAYLDIIREVRNSVDTPVAAYMVSGEYSMIKAAAEKGLIDEKKAMLESLFSIKRAGADIIATYFAKDFVNNIEN